MDGTPRTPFRHAALDALDVLLAHVRAAQSAPLAWAPAWPEHPPGLALAVASVAGQSADPASGRSAASVAGASPPELGGAPGGAELCGPDRQRIAALVELARQGDTDAFAAIYDAYVDDVYRYVYYRCGSHPLAEDLTSETFLRALRRIGDFTWQGRDIGAWFVTIARNLIADHVKSSRFRLEVSTADMLDADRPDEGIEGQVLTRLQHAALVDAVRQLKPDQQECIVLRFLQGLSVAETALAMGRTEGAVKQLQLRAIRSLARLLPEPER